MWQPSISKAAAVAAMLAVVAAASVARAATFSVEPIAVSLGKSDSSTTVAITNQSPDKLRLQITGFAWQQSTAGAMQLSATDDLIFFPQLLELDPGETRRVRIGVTAEKGPVEKTFRVFMEELPSLGSVVAPKTNSVTIRMKIGIPVFVSANVPAVISGSVGNAIVRSNALDFDVLNSGNTHFSIKTVHLSGKNAAGAEILSRDIPGWYLLAGGTRHFTVPLPKDACSALRSLSVAVTTDTLSITKALPELNKECGSVSSR